MAAFLETPTKADQAILASFTASEAGQQLLAAARKQRLEQRLAAERGIVAANARAAKETPPLVKQEQVAAERVRKLETELREAKNHHLILHREVYSVGHSIDTQRARCEAVLAETGKEDLRAFLDRLEAERERIGRNSERQEKRTAVPTAFSFLSDTFIKDVVVRDNVELIKTKAVAIAAAGNEAARLVSTTAVFDLEPLWDALPGIALIDEV